MYISPSNRLNINISLSILVKSKHSEQGLSRHLGVQISAMACKDNKYNDHNLLEAIKSSCLALELTYAQPNVGHFLLQNKATCQ